MAARPEAPEPARFLTGPVDPTSAAADADEPAIVVELTPRSYRGRGVVALAAGLGAMVWVIHGTDVVVAVYPLVGIGYGIYWLVQARRQVTRTLLTIDRSGFRSGDGLYDRTWAGVVLVWVGSATGLRVRPIGDVVASVFTASGVDFAHRAGTAPRARATLHVGAFRSVPQLCERLREITDAQVVDGTEVSRRRAAARL